MKEKKNGKGKKKQHRKCVFDITDTKLFFMTRSPNMHRSIWSEGFLVL